MKKIRKCVGTLVTMVWVSGCFTGNLINSQGPDISSIVVRVSEREARPLAIAWRNEDEEQPLSGVASLDLPLPDPSCGGTVLLQPAVGAGGVARVRSDQEFRLSARRTDPRQAAQRALKELASRQSDEAVELRNAVANHCAVLFVLAALPGEDQSVLRAFAWDREAELKIDGRDAGRFILVPATVALDALTLPLQAPAWGLVGLLCLAAGGCDNFK